MADQWKGARKGIEAYFRDLGFALTAGNHAARIVEQWVAPSAEALDRVLASEGHRGRFDAMDLATAMDNAEAVLARYRGEESHAE